TKQEFGLTCLVLLGSTVTINFLSQRSSVELKRNLLWGFAGLSPAVAVYGCFVWKLTAKVIFVDNWIATPGTYMMRTFGSRTMALNGYRFSPHEWIVAASTVVIALGSWYLIAAGDAGALSPLSLLLRTSRVGVLP